MPLLNAVPAVSQHLRTGTLRPLGVTTEAESRHLPGVKSFAEQGLAGFEAPTWWAHIGGAGAPEPIMHRMQETLCRALATPEVRIRIGQQGVGRGGERSGWVLGAERRGSRGSASAAVRPARYGSWKMVSP